jgi:hypothetical protein
VPLNGVCINCESPSEENKEYCESISVKPTINEPKRINLENPLIEALEEAEEVEEEMIKPRKPYRTTYRKAMGISMSGMQRFSSMFSNANFCTQMARVNIEGLTEGTDFRVNCNYRERRNALVYGVTYLRDTPRRRVTLRTNDPKMFMSDKLREEEQTWDGEYDSNNNEEEEEVYGNESEESNRVLQEEENSQEVYMPEQSMEASVKGRRAPSDKSLKFATNFGKFFKWLMVGLCVMAIVLSLVSKLRQGLTGHLIKLFFLIEFFSSIAFIPINFGFLLINFLDEVVKFDFLLMWKIINERKFRGSLGGKFDEYSIPVLALNTTLLPLVLYVLSSLINIISKRKNSSYSSIHLVILAVTYSDVVLYGSLEVFNHNPFKKGNSFGSILSYILALAGLVLAAIDFVNFLKATVSSGKKRSPTVETNPESKSSAYEEFAITGLAKDSESSKSLAKFINFGYIVRFILTQIVIALFQGSPKLMFTIIFISNIVYIVFFLASGGMGMSYSSRLLKAQKMLAEVLMLVLLIFLMLFTMDDENDIYSSNSTERIQKFFMFAMLIIIVSELFMLMMIFMKFIRKKKQAQQRAIDYRDEEIVSFILIV